MNRYTGLFITLVMLTALLTPVAGIAAATPRAKSTPITADALEDIWLLPVPGSVSAAVEYDANNDGVKDVIASSDTWVAFLSGEDGFPIGNYTAPVNTSISNVYYVGDNDGDGYPEYVIDVSNTTSTNIVHRFVCYEPATGEVRWESSYTAPGGQAMVFSSIFPYYGDGTLTISFGVMEVSGLTPTMYTDFVTINLADGSISVDTVDDKVYLVYTNVLVGDLDNDGLADVDIGTYTEASYIQLAGFPIPSLQSTMEFSGPGISWSYTWDNPGIAAIGIAANDGGETHLLVLFVDLSSQNPVFYVYGFNMETGSYEYSVQLGITPSNAFSIAGDVVAVGGYSDTYGENVFYIIDTSNGDYEVAGVGGDTSTPLSSMSVGDVVGDGSKYMLYSLGGDVYLMNMYTGSTQPVDSYSGNVTFFDGNYYKHPTAGTIYVFTEHYGSGGLGVTIIHAARFTGAGGNDTTPPEVSILTPGDGSVVGKHVYVTASVDDPESGISYIEISVTGPNGFSIEDNMSYDAGLGMAYYDFDVPEDGEYTITVTAYNGAGMPGTDAVTVEADTVPPVITITSPENMSTIIGDSFTLEFTVEDTHSVSGTVLFDTVPVATWSGTGEHSITINVPGSVVGQHKVTVAGADEAGNYAEESIYINIAGEDTTPPVVAITSPADGALLPGAFYVKATVYDNESGIVNVTITVTSDGETVLEGSMTYDPSTSTARSYVEAPGSGVYTVTVTATNGAGETSSDSVTVTVDAEPPNVEIVEPATGTKIPPVFNLTVAVSDDHPESLTVTVSQGGLVWNKTVSIKGLPKGSTVTLTVNLTGFNDGPVHLYVHAVDEVNNTGGASASYTLVAHPAPALTASIGNMSVLYGVATVSINASIDVDVAYDVIVFIDNETYAVYRGIHGSFEETITINTTSLGDGVHYMKIIGATPYGSATYTVTFFVDNTAPSIEAPYPENTPVWLSRGEYSEKQDEPGIYVVEFTVSIYEKLLSKYTIYLDGEEAAGGRVVYAASPPRTMAIEEAGISSVIITTLPASHVSLKNMVRRSGEPGVTVELEATEYGYDLKIKAFLDNGLHNITVWVEDMAGRNASYTILLGIDAVPPTISSFTATVSNNTVTLTWSVSDTGSGVAELKLLLNGEEINVTGMTSYTATLEPGNYTATLVAVDNTGNTANKTVEFTVQQPSGGTAGGTTGGEQQGGGAGENETTGETTGGGEGGGVSPVVIAAVVAVALIGAAVYMLFVRKSA